MIEIGEQKKGIDLLFNDVDSKFPNSQTLSAAMYLSLAYYQLEELGKAAKQMDFVEANRELLDSDELLLLERIQGKIAILDTH